MRLPSWLLLALLLTAAPAAALELALRGEPEIVFRWARDRCETWHIPDAPARAFRAADGMVRLMAAHNRNRIMRGASLAAPLVDCAVVFRGAEADAPEAYDDKVWLSALWTEDGSIVHALAHAEYHGQHRPRVCPAAQYMACWRNQLVHVVSRDAGTSFQRRGVAFAVGPPYRFDGALGRRSGHFEPSNIFRHGGALHAFVWAEEQGAQRRGACLLRTADIADPRAWRAWGGTAFDVVFRDPYREPIADPARHACRPIAGLDGVVASVVRHAASGLHVAVFASHRIALADGSRPSGIWYATSADLIRWSAPKLLAVLPLPWAFACGEHAVWAYPSLIDRDSTARNFDEMGASAELYLTRFNLAGACRPSADRDLVRFGVAIQG